MKLENQVISLEISKMLKELGVKQESLFYWVEFSVVSKGHSEYNPKWELRYEKVSLYNFPDKISAFTLSELGEIMKGQGMGITAYSFIEKKWWIRGGKWIVEKQQYQHLIVEEKWADALGKMLIYLLENNLITLNN